MTSARQTDAARRTRRRLLVVAAIVLVGLALVRLAVRPTFIGGYQEIDDYNVALRVLGASPAWRSVTGLTETSSDVRVGVSEIVLQFGPGFGDERIAYVVVTLKEPLASRQVIDASSGVPIPRIAQ